MGGKIKPDDAGTADMVREILLKKYKYVYEEAGVRGYYKGRLDPTPSGMDSPMVFKINEKGERARVDFLVSNDGRTWEGIESKKRLGSGYQPQQRIQYPRINAHGGKLAFHGRPLTEMPEEIGTTVKSVSTLYKTDAEAVNNGWRDLDELLDSRRGIYEPPEDSPTRPPKGADNAGPAGRRGIEANGLGQGGTTDRGLDAGDGPDSRGTKAQGADPPEPPGQARLDARRADPGPRRASKIGRIKSTATKLYAHRPKFTGNLILEIAKMTLFGWLQGKLNRVNQEMIGKSYRANVFRPHVEKHLEDVAGMVRRGTFLTRNPRLENRFLYHEHSYTIHMRLEGKDVSGKIIWFFQGAEFAETFVKLTDVAVQEKPLLPTRRPLEDTHRIEKRKDTDTVEIVTARHHQALLIYSHRAHDSYLLLTRHRKAVIGLLARIVSRPFIADTDWADRAALALAEKINGYEFAAAEEAIEEVVPFPYSAAFGDLIVVLGQGDALLGLTKVMSAAERAVLGHWLEADPFTSRDKIHARRRKDQIRKQALPVFDLHKL